MYQKKLGLWGKIHTAKVFAILNKLRHKVLVKFINRAKIKNYCHHVGLVTNPFHATGLFLNPLDSLGNLWFSDVFRGYRKRPILWDGSTHIRLTRSWRRSLSYRSQFIDLPSKSLDWFLYDGDLRYERVRYWNNIP